MISSPSTHRGLPPLVGLADFETAARPGLSVETAVGRLKRFHYSLWRLHEILIGRLTAEPIYELKMAFSYHAHLCAENDTGFRTRVGEMREPPLGLEKTPHAALGVFFDEILSAPSTVDLVLGLYDRAFPLLRASLSRYVEETHPLADAPSRRLCRLALLDINDICAYGDKVVACLVSSEDLAASEQWLTLLDVCVAQAGGLDGSSGMSVTEGASEPTRYYSSKPFVFDGEPRRDDRFPDPYNMGVNGEEFLYDDAMPDDAKVLMMYYKRLREIDVPEMMASIITETKGKPWGYSRDMTRQLWDEARHAMMGEVGFASLGLDWPNLVMINSTWSRSLNLQLKPQERHAVLYYIEQGLMPRTGKRHEWEVSKRGDDPLAVTFQDFDWADEVLHARIGRDWYVKGMGSPQAAVEYGDECWTRVLVGWKKWKDDGLTQHRNWWPDAYLAFCSLRGVKPDPRALAYNTSYESKRADLKGIST